MKKVALIYSKNSPYYELLSGEKSKLGKKQYQLLFTDATPQGLQVLSWKTKWQVPMVVSVDGNTRLNKNERKQLFSLADAILFPCQAIKEKWVKAGCTEEQGIVHYRGIDLKKIEYKIRMMPREGPVTILFRGPLEDKDGCHALIKAFQMVHNKFPRTQLRLIGDGKWKKNLMTLAVKLRLDQAVHFLGNLTAQEVRQQLSQAHLFCLPVMRGSNGIPDPLLEAMASGIPVASTFHSGISEVIHDGVNGCLAAEKTSSSIAHKLTQLMEQPQIWERLGKAAREKMETQFNQEKQMEELERLFEQIVHKYQEKRSKPFFSVIIPAYNREKFIGKAIRSVLKQTCDDYELIVVDDGSTDRTKKIVKSFGKRVKYVYQKNRGPSAARNTGIRHAKGEYIVFLDSDDRFFPNKLEMNKRYLKKHPKCKFLYSWYYDQWDKVRRRRIQKTRAYKNLQKFRFRLYQRAFTIRTSTVVIHRSCFDKVGLFGKRYKTSQDWDMWLRLAKHYLGSCQKTPLVLYRRHKRAKNSARTRRYHARIRKTARRLYRWTRHKLKRLEQKYGHKKRRKIKRKKVKRFSLHRSLLRRLRRR